MIRHIVTFMHLLNRTTLRNVVCLALFVAAGFVAAPMVAQIRRGGRCPPCSSLLTLSENFDGVTAPALPQGWLATNALGSPPLWVTSDSGVPFPPSETPPNAVFIDDPAALSDKRLDSLSFSFFESCCAQISFRHNFNLEASEVDPNLGFDGGVLELSTDGGNTFQDIIAAGGSFVMGGYNRTIAADRGSPIAGRQAWSGNSGGFMFTVVNVPSLPEPAGTKFRWRVASDTTGSGEGWRVDTVIVSRCFAAACTPGPTPRSRPTPAPRP
jgi:hypothetical protein